MQNYMDVVDFINMQPFCSAYMKCTATTNDTHEYIDVLKWKQFDTISLKTEIKTF